MEEVWIEILSYLDYNHSKKFKQLSKKHYFIYKGIKEILLKRQYRLNYSEVKMIYNKINIKNFIWIKGTRNFNFIENLEGNFSSKQIPYFLYEYIQLENNLFVKNNNFYLDIYIDNLLNLSETLFNFYQITKSLKVYYVEQENIQRIDYDIKEIIVPSYNFFQRIIMNFFCLGIL